MSNVGLVWRWWILAEVRLQDGESIESALRRFKRKVQTEEIIKEVERPSYYLNREQNAGWSKPWRDGVPEKRYETSGIELQAFRSLLPLSFQRTRFYAR
jgi:ribosomal protein S21